MRWQHKNITETLPPIKDSKIINVRRSWFSESRSEKSYSHFAPKAEEWFKASKVNDIHGWSSLPCVDVTMGCTHYIESLVQKYGWDGFQVLKNEYAYYTLMGKHGVEVDSLEPNKPMIITMPHWTFCDVRPEWEEILKTCEQKNIDIHIDMAWIITARDIVLDLAHPCIKSVGVSLSKLGLQWSRVGLRFSRQKSMDSITVFNDFYHDTNTVITSIGAYWIDNFERDYLWQTHGSNHVNLCQQLGLMSTKIIHVAKQPVTNKSLGIGNMLGQSAPHSI